MEGFKDGVLLAGVELLAQGLDLLLESAGTLSDAIDAADVTLEELVDVDSFVELELFEIFDELELLFVILDSIQGEDEDVGRIFDPALVDADLRLTCFIVGDLIPARLLPVIH